MDVWEGANLGEKQTPKPLPFPLGSGGVSDVTPSSEPPCLLSTV